ncbi:MAG TPA: IS66 family transposase [Pyrinomonadaceae bacterium]
MLREGESFAAESDGLPPLGTRSDREAAHYYRAMHARAVQREQRWKEKALAAEQIIKQLLVLLGSCVQKRTALTRQVTWLNKQQFGSKSEATRPAPEATAPASVGGAEGAEQPTTQRKRKRGQQPGGKGPKRRSRQNLPEETTHHHVSEEERTCPICHKIRPEIGLTEESEEIEWEVCLKRRRHVRHCYGPSCHCASGQGIRTAPKPAKLIPKGLFAVSFWVEVLLKKFEFKQPLQRIVSELKTLDLEVSPGTLTGGLKKIQPMLHPLVGQFVLRSREGCHWHMDETRWPMFLLVEGEKEDKSPKKWWAWVVVGADATAFLLEPSRSSEVPETFFPKGTEGILNVDRFPSYFGLLGPDWKIKLAYCWSHQRRDFVNLGEGCRRHKEWAQQWVGLINQLFSANRKRRKAWFKERSDFGPLDQEVRHRVQEIKERLDQELAGGQLAAEEEKILRSMRRHWEGLTLFVDHPHVPMDNNAAERALRTLAVARKNFYGSGSKWSGELACGCFTILATLRQHGICPRRYFRAYLEACARQGDKAPENLEEFLPWKWSPEKKAAWRTQEQAP